MNQHSRNLYKPKLNLEGTICGLSPVQAEGTINGHSFYFRARHDEWSFAISEATDIDPVDIEDIESGEKHGFFKEDSFGKKGGESASYMPLDKAESIILACCSEYIFRNNTKKNKSTLPNK